MSEELEDPMAVEINKAIDAAEHATEEIYRVLLDSGVNTYVFLSEIVSNLQDDLKEFEEDENE